MSSRRCVPRAPLLAVALCAMVSGPAEAAAADIDALERHFFGASPTCRHKAPVPLLVVADLTLTGEIDDSISLVMYRQLERRGCVRVLGVVSIFGNGPSRTDEVHRNLEVRPAALGVSHWPLLRGPDESHRKVRNWRAGRPDFERLGTIADQERLRRIAAVIRAADVPVVIVELGPMTISARLLEGGFVAPNRIERILGVGGRLRGERFGRNAGFVGRVGSFTDFNVRKDTKAVDYLIRHVPEKLFMVTYRSGVGARMVSAALVAGAVPPLAEHAHKRQRWLNRMLGYTGIPSWDTWTSAYFLQGRAPALGCVQTWARIENEPKARWPRLIVNQHIGVGSQIMVCHPGAAQMDGGAAPD